MLELAAQRSPRLHVVVLPGNPGRAGFYVPFLESLHRAFDGAACISAVTYLGFDCQGLTPPDRVFSLEEQITHKQDYLRLVASKSKGLPMVIIGHSIGAYMACRIHQQEPSAHVVALMPFFTVNETCRVQRRLRSLTMMYAQLAWASRVLALLPLFLKRFLVKLISPRLEAHAVETAVALIHPTAVRNGFFLGGSEFEGLAAPADWASLAALGTRFTTFCAPQDVWMPRSCYDDMIQAGSAKLHPLCLPAAMLGASPSVPRFSAGYTRHPGALLGRPASCILRVCSAFRPHGPQGRGSRAAHIRKKYCHMREE